MNIIEMDETFKQWIFEHTEIVKNISVISGIPKNEIEYHLINILFWGENKTYIP